MQLIYNSFGFLFYQASLALQDFLLPALNDAGLNAKQMGLLFIVKDNDGITQKSAGAIQRIDRTTMTQHVDSLEKLNILKRIPLESDRRAHGLHLTEKGMDMVENLLTSLNEAQSAFFEGLSDVQVDELQKLLIKLINREDDLT